MNKIKLSEIGLLLGFKIILEIAYILFVNPYYRYAGFPLQLNGLKLLESYLFLLFLFFFLPPGEHKISSVGTKLLFLLMIVPTLSLYALKNESRVFLYLFVAGFWLTLLTVQILPGIRVKRVKNLNSILFFSIGIFSILVYATLMKLNGIPTLRALDFASVYEIRAVVKHGPKVMGYLIPWQAQVINCFLIGLSWYKRKYFCLLAMLSLQFLLFLITAHKSFLFSPLLIIFLIYAIQKKRLLRLSLIALIIVVLFSLLFYKISGRLRIPSMFIRRVFFVPALNYFNYYDFFSKNQLMYLSDSHLGSLFSKNPYNMPIPNMIGMLYHDHPTTWVNTGYLANAYMNFGFLGILLFSLILGVIFLMMDSIA
ncbi:MAG: O-antigen polymerase, partial [Candidatus Heimdallarchaeaceae archaeon]